MKAADEIIGLEVGLKFSASSGTAFDKGREVHLMFRCVNVYKYFSRA